MTTIIPPHPSITPILPETGESLMQALKVKTAMQHLALETSLDIFNRCLTRQGYLTLLARFYGFYAPVETALAAVTGPLAGPDRGMDLGLDPGLDLDLDPGQRFKSAWLKQDLISLGLTPAAVAGLPQCRALPSLYTVEQALGCMYVLEGATLGGQIILRFLKERPFYRDGEGFRFFTAYGPAVGSMWKSFAAALEAYRTANSNPNLPLAVIAAATGTFEKMDRWMAGVEQ